MVVFILELFGKEYSDKLLYKSCKETIKMKTNSFLIFMMKSDLICGLISFDEISLNLFDDKYQFVYDNLFDLFITNFWNKESQFCWTRWLC